MVDDTADLTSPESRAPFIIGITISLTSLSTIFAGLRLYTRTYILRSPGLEDAAIAVTQVLAIGLAIATCLEAHYGLGSHIGFLSQDQVMSQLKSLFTAILIYIWALCSVKVALLLQYRRIFSVLWIRKVALALVGVFVAWNCVQSILVGLACIPVAVFTSSHQATCIDSLTVWYIAAVINISTDFVVFALPLPAIKSLRLPVRQKLIISCIFCLGFFTCIISIVRATILHLVTSSSDTSWVGQGAAVWSVVEINCAIICACLPTLKPLFSQLLPGLLSTDRRNSYAAGGAPSAGGHALRSPKALTLRSSSTEALQDGSLEPSNYANERNVSISAFRETWPGGDEETDQQTWESGSTKRRQNIYVTTETVILEETSAQSSK